MSTGGFSFGKGSQEIDLNLAPIIDCLTVLVTFMLASASFLSIGILEAGVGAAGESSVTQHAPAITLQAEIGMHGEITLKTSGKINTTVPIHGINEQADYSHLKAEIQKLKQTYPDLQSLVLSASEEVSYKEIVQTMDEIRGVMATVFLGGF